jgi:hypothetical protein
MRLWTTLVAAIVGGAVAAAIAVATIPDSSGTINGCYTPSGGPQPLSVVDAPSDCKDTLLPFNQTGPAGPAGTVGNVQLAFAEIVQTDEAQHVYGATATCPAGRLLLSGGFDLGSHADNYDIAASKPVVVGGAPRAWEGRFALKPAIIREREISDTLLGAFNSYLGRSSASEEEGRRALAGLFGGFLPGGAGGGNLTRKERKKIATGIEKLHGDDVRLGRASTRTRTAIEDLLAFAPPTTIPEAAVFALCGSA